VQPSLEVGRVDDPLEREADAVKLTGSSLGFSTGRMTVPPAGGGRDPAARQHRRDRHQRPGVGALGADTDRRIQTRREGGRIRRRVDVADPASGVLDADTDRRIQTRRGGGAPMDGDTRARMEHAFDADFRSVRVHEGAAVSELNTRIQAKAFTLGNGVFFRDGVPDTSLSEGQRLLAHELTHTIQQNGRVRRSRSQGGRTSGHLVQRGETKAAGRPSRR
jgi:hypothetical protein